VDALKERRADGTALTGTFDDKQTVVDLASLVDQLGQMLEPGTDAKVPRLVDDGLNAKRSPFFEVFTDLPAVGALWSSPYYWPDLPGVKVVRPRLRLRALHLDSSSVPAWRRQVRTKGISRPALSLVSQLVLLDPGVLVGEVHVDVGAGREDAAPERFLSQLVVVRTWRAKTIDTWSGRPMPTLSATSDSKKTRARRGSSNTRVRDTSTCRMESSHQ
jgi:hypothetical protein